MTEIYLGEINGHIIGRILKEAVRRATVVIRNERSVFETTTKLSYGGTMDDVFTTADRKAQDVYLRTFAECLPRCGVIGEEDSLIIPSAEGCDAYFTIDPLDGTKAYIRRQSHGVSTMVALVVGGEVVSGYIGDINADEVYGFRPGSDKVFRISRLDSFEQLGIEEPTPNREQFALLRDPAQKYSALTQTLLSQFKNHEVMGSSIGTWMARLWKREITAALLPPGYETPWDSTPVIGISQKLDYLFLRPNDAEDGWEAYTPILPRKVMHREHDLLVIHPQDAISIGLLPR